MALDPKKLDLDAMKAALETPDRFTPLSPWTLDECRALLHLEAVTDRYIQAERKNLLSLLREVHDALGLEWSISRLRTLRERLAAFLIP